MTDHIPPGTKPTGTSKTSTAWVVEWVRDDGSVRPIGAADTEQDAIYEKIKLAKGGWPPPAVLRVTEYRAHAPETAAAPVKSKREENYATHKPRSSDSSLYDEICTVCGARDMTMGEDELSVMPCPGAALKANQPSNSAPSAVVSRNVAPSNEGAKPATVGADPLAQLEDDATFGAIVEEIQAKRGEKSEPV